MAAVEFRFSKSGSVAFRELEAQVPGEPDDTLRARELAIILGDQLLTAPSIVGRRSDQSEEEVIRRIEWHDVDPNELVEFVLSNADCAEDRQSE